MVKKKIVSKAKETASTVDEKEQAIKFAQNQVARFEKMKAEATTTEQLEQSLFWIKHWTSELAILEQA